MQPSAQAPNLKWYTVLEEWVTTILDFRRAILTFDCAKPIGYSYHCNVAHQRTYLHKYKYCETKVNLCICVCLAKGSASLNEYAVLMSRYTMYFEKLLSKWQYLGSNHENCSTDGHWVIIHCEFLLLLVLLHFSFSNSPDLNVDFSSYWS
jgi:hypothetical protein